MFSSRATEHIAFLSRQLARIPDEADTSAELAKLRSACPEQYHAEIAYLEGLLDGRSGEGPGLGRHPYRILGRLIDEAPRGKNVLLKGFVEYLRQSKIAYETYWAGVVGMVWYLATLAVVLLVVSVIFSTSTIPAFHQLFTDFGAELPLLTSAVFKLGGIWVPAVTVAVVLLVGAIAWFATTFHRRIQRIEPLPKWPAWLPLAGTVSSYYNLGLLLNYARLLIDAGATPEHAIRVAAREAKQPDFSLDRQSGSVGDIREDQALTELAIAAKLGTLKDEIAFQCEEHLGNLSLVLVDARDRFSLLLKVTIYSFVALLVIAMYLPIFKLGSVI